MLIPQSFWQWDEIKEIVNDSDKKERSFERRPQ
jgi:hypothetical protein